MSERLIQLFHAFHFSTYPAHADYLRDFCTRQPVRKFVSEIDKKTGNIEIEELEHSTLARVS